MTELHPDTFDPASYDPELDGPGHDFTDVPLEEDRESLDVDYYGDVDDDYYEG